MSIVWKDDYSVRSKELDNQHRKLISLINNLDDAMREGKGKIVLGPILKELVDYTHTHFANEERLMEKHGFPGYSLHKDKHAKMTQKVLDIQQQYREGRVSITIEVMNFLENWLDKHILGTDKEYASYLADK